MEQKPNPHQILGQMLIEEQTMLNRLTQTRQAWNLTAPYILNTIAGQSEYTIAQPVGTHVDGGKVYFVVRATGEAENPYIPVEYDDYSEQNYGKMMSPANSVNRFRAEELISFYRAGAQDQSIKAVIQPAPQEILRYEITFYTGALVRDLAAMDKAAALPELADYLDVKSSLALLPYCFWKGFSIAENREKRKDLSAGLLFQFSEIKPVAENYILQINSPTSFDMDYWND